jgi:aspartyl-tRNA(Asn)/glutamyl-tRNA(Gln) amidotransferase subunit A
LKDGVKGLRIGLIRHFHEVDCPVSPGMAAGIADVANVLQGQGAIVEEVTLPSLHDFNAAGWIILAADAFAVHEPWLRTKFRDYGEILRERLALAGTISAADYLQAQRRRRELCDAVAKVMEGCDLLLTAGAPGEARLITEMGTWASFESPNFTIPFNLTGQPALTVCAGFGAGGLPVGVQLVGRPFEDATVLRAGHAYEQATGWRAMRPAMAG